MATDIVVNRVRGLLDAVFPRICTICEEPAAAEFGYLCWDCRSDFQVVNRPFCELCGDPVYGRIDHVWTCRFCATRDIGFSKARSAIRYSGPVRRLLQQFKYEQAIWLRADLAELLAACVYADMDADSFDLVVPVPLYPGRLRRRTYNQAALLAKELSRRIGVPFMNHVLSRTRDTSTQTELNAREREQNVAGAFSVDKEAWVKGRRLLLVDDVMTTGATLNACAHALKAAGTADVQALTVARG